MLKILNEGIKDGTKYGALQRIEKSILDKCSSDYTAKINKNRGCVEIFKLGDEQPISVVFPGEPEKTKKIHNYRLRRVYPEDYGKLKDTDEVYIREPQEDKHIKTWSSKNTTIKMYGDEISFEDLVKIISR